MNPTAVRLSCEQCKRRKIRCDKEVPSCSSCRNAGTTCHAVQRTRLPRGRTGRIRNQSLETKVSRLEALVHQLGAQMKSSSEDTISRTSDGSKNLSLAQQKPLNEHAPARGGEFWSMLSEEISSLRDTIEVSEEEDIFPNADDSMTSPSTNSTFLFNGPNSQAQPFSQPTNEVKANLLSLYKDRVDRLFKVLHWPSTMLILQQLDQPDSLVASIPGSAERTLRSAIYFAASTTVLEPEAERLLGMPKQEIRKKHRGEIEAELAHSNLLQEPSLMDLQAFVIYLLALRTIDPRTSWTLIATASRLASIHDLGHEDPFKFSSFEQEMRRRLWFSLGVIDSGTALDRGLPHMIPVSEFVAPPSNINDAELPAPELWNVYRTDFTDMSFACMTHRATICQKTLCEKPSSSDNIQEHWNRKIAAIASFEAYVGRQFDQIHYENATDFESHAKAVAESIGVHFQILCRRPPYRCKENPVPSSDEFDLLYASLQLLEHYIDRSVRPESAPWCWFSWCKWYALAILLAELCCRPPGTAPSRAFTVAEDGFRRYSRVVEVTNSQSLWKPMTRLMKQVQAIRQKFLQLTDADDAQPGLIGYSDVQLAAADPFSFDNRTMAFEPGLPFTDVSKLDSRAQGLMPQGSFTSVHELQELSVPVADLSWVNWNLFLADMNDSYTGTSS